MLIVIFWISIAVILYSYLLYPLVLFVLSCIVQLKRLQAYLFKGVDWRKAPPATCDLPSVSFVVSAHNEGLNIRKRIENCFNLNYPEDKLEIIIGSDGSTDDTEGIVESFSHPRVKLFSYPRCGKINVLNKTIPRAKGEIVVLSDANTYFMPEALKQLIRHFSDAKVGAVSGELKLLSKDGQSQEEDAYWRYETILKFLENRIGGTLGANGAIYAIRKDLFNPISEDTIIDDFVIPMKIKERGYEVIYDYEARAHEEGAGEAEVEFERRIRIGAGGFQAIRHTWRLLDFRRGSTALAYWSHKVLRWFIPFLLILCFALNSMLLSAFLYIAIFFCQLLFYGLAVIGYFRRRKTSDKKMFKIPFYFIYINLALLIGFFRFISGRQKAAWKRTLRPA